MRRIAAIAAGVAVTLGLTWGVLRAARSSSSGAPRSRAVPESGKPRAAPRVGREVARFPVGSGLLRALAVGPGDLIYLAGEDGLAVLSPEGRMEARWPGDQTVSGLAVDEEGFVYVARRDRVEIRDAEGKVWRTWAVPHPGAWITSLAVSDGGLFLADFGCRGIHRCDREGRIRGTFRGTEPERFVVPSPYFDVAVDPVGYLWVAHTGRHRMESYRPEGSRVGSWGASSDGPEGFAGCCNPAHFAIGRDGTFVTSEKGIVRVKLYDPGGAFLGIVAPPEDFAPAGAPPEVAADAQGRLWVADPGLGALRLYAAGEAARGNRPESRPPGVR